MAVVGSRSAAFLDVLPQCYLSRLTNHVPNCHLASPSSSQAVAQRSTGGLEISAFERLTQPTASHHRHKQVLRWHDGPTHQAAAPPRTHTPPPPPQPSYDSPPTQTTRALHPAVIGFPLLPTLLRLTVGTGPCDTSGWAARPAAAAGSPPPSPTAWPPTPAPPPEPIVSRQHRLRQYSQPRCERACTARGYIRRLTLMVYPSSPFSLAPITVPKPTPNHPSRGHRARIRLLRTEQHAEDRHG